MRFSWGASVTVSRAGGDRVVRWRHVVMVRRQPRYVVVRLTTIVEGRKCGEGRFVFRLVG